MVLAMRTSDVASLCRLLVRSRSSHCRDLSESICYRRFSGVLGNGSHSVVATSVRIRLVFLCRLVCRELLCCLYRRIL